MAGATHPALAPALHLQLPQQPVANGLQRNVPAAAQGLLGTSSASADDWCSCHTQAWGGSAAPTSNRQSGVIEHRN